MFINERLNFKTITQYECEDQDAWNDGEFYYIDTLGLI